MEPYVRVIANDRQIQEIDNNVSRCFNSIQTNPLLANPMYITGLVFTGTADLIVNHRLNRPVRGYIISRSDAGQTIYTSSTVNPAPSAQIILKATGTINADILFF